VFHTTTEATLHDSVADERALDAFHHPFAHLQIDASGVAAGAKQLPKAVRREELAQI
jgi:hypothetical protein